jgi:DNA repair exonuclease SbcCD ATPase subunit
MIYVDYVKKLSQAEGKYNLLNDQKSTIKKTLKDNKKYLINLEKAQVFIQQVAKETQEQLKYQISDLVNLALDSCFPGEYTFDVNFEIKYGKTSAELVFINKNGTQIDPMEASGGGVVDLASFALRIAIWSLGKSNNVIILDEPFKNLQPMELHMKGMEMIKMLSTKLGIQFIIVTNSVQNADLIDISDKVFDVKKINDISKVTVR